MSLSPRQIIAYLEFNNRLDRIDQQINLKVTAVGAQGDSKTIAKTLKGLSSQE
jgi:hypothetical protein